MIRRQSRGKKRGLSPFLKGTAPFFPGRSQELLQLAQQVAHQSAAGSVGRLLPGMEAKLEKVLDEIMDLSPRGIREHLGLNRPIYARTSAYGHFGRAPEADGGFSWERTDLVDQLKRAV